MEGIKNFLQLINDNWPTIVAILGLVYAIYYKVTITINSWKAKSKIEKNAEIQKQIDAAKRIIGEQILKLVSMAELEWQSDSCQLGPVRRAEVIEKIYSQYPILLCAASQDEMIGYIDGLIDKSLVVIREMVKKESGAA